MSTKQPIWQYKVASSTHDNDGEIDIDGLKTISKKFAASTANGTASASEQEHDGRIYHIGANNGSKRSHAQGASAASTHAGKQGRPHRDGGLKSPPLTRHQQAHTGKHSEHT